MAAVGSRDETGTKPRSDAYVGLLGVSLLALIAAMLFAYLNWSTISEKPKPVQVAPAGGAARPAPAPAPGPGVANPPPGPGATQPGAAQHVPPADGKAPPPPPQKK